MSRNELVHRLAQAGARNDQRTVRDTMHALIAEAHAQQQHSYATRLSSALPESEQKRRPVGRSPMLPEHLQPLLYERTPRRPVAELVLGKTIRGELRDFVSEFSQAALLRSHSLEPRHTVLLIGPPGTGKTSLASSLAYEMGLPFLVVRYDGLVGSYLGETASRLQQIVDYVTHTPAVLFFDEFESVGKERGDSQETGEIKRVVSSLLLHMDSLPSHCVVVCATNHPELLDRAVWRRFELRLELPLPGPAELKEWYNRVQRSFGSIGISGAEFASLFAGESFSEVEAITLDARRISVLSKGALGPAEAFAEALDRWDRRRRVGGERVSGKTTGRKDSPRASRRSAAAGKEASLSQTDLLSGSS